MPWCSGLADVLTFKKKHIKEYILRFLPLLLMIIKHIKEQILLFLLLINLIIIIKRSINTCQKRIR